MLRAMDDGIAQAAVSTIPANNVDLNTLTTSGMYRLGDAFTNGPGGTTYNYGQLLVIHGGQDTIVQMIFNYASPFSVQVRMGNPPNVGGTGTWGAWTGVALMDANGYVAKAIGLKDGGGVYRTATTPGGTEPSSVAVTDSNGRVGDSNKVDGIHLRNNSGSLEWSTDGSTWNSSGMLKSQIVKIAMIY
jgi:hypothetical protein